MPMNVIILGGSLAGLMQGIMLRSLGHNVHILEQAANQRESHMAGVCCAADCLEFLRKFDRIATPFSLKSERLQAVNHAGRVNYYLKAPRQVTSWDAFYWRLRANFDGFASEYYPHPPPVDYEGAGPGLFSARHRATAVEPRGPTVLVRCQNLETLENQELEADLVLAADGPNSATRLKYLPESKRGFSGYVAWRGTVRESEISPEARKVFEKNVTLNLMNDDHALIYIIPGDKGSLKEGERLMNFLWYTNETPESLDDIMRDQAGHRHQYIVPAGKVRPEVWKRLLDRGALLSDPHREVMDKIQAPFIQSITDFVSPQAALADGKILLVGDALSLYRPHTASSTNQAAFHCLMLERLVRGEIDAQEWEREVLQFAHLHWSRSVWYGENYQHPLRETLPRALSYWYAAAADTVRAVWYWQPSKLRW